MSVASGSEISELGRPLPAKLYGYDVVDYIGQGAGSDIYAVTDPLTKRLYALKHVVRKTEKHQRFIEQVTNEYEVSRQFSHPNLRRSFDLKLNRTLLRKVSDAGLIMEMFDGQALELYVPRSMSELVGFFIQTARGLGAMHDEGFLHCDLKPSNILIGPGGDVKIIDFGQACPIGTRKARIQGTPDYIAPEQVRLGAVTIRTDVFNFGATLYGVLSGGRKLPTLYTLKREQNSFLLDEAITPPTAINPDVPEVLSNLVMECVRTNPAKRPEDMKELINRMEIVQHAIRKQEEQRAAAAAVIPA